MRLLIISHTPHYLDNGIVKGWGPTLREIDHLATLFDEVVHIAPLHRESAPSSALPYKCPRVRLVAVPPAGGKRLVDKLRIVRHIASYLRTISQELRQCDVVHVRCPANLSLLAVIILAFVKHPQKRWIKYAGNWRPQKKDALSYRFQRWWLKRNFSRAQVTVNGVWPDSPEHIHAFLNPCLTDDELAEGRNAAKEKELDYPLHFLFVGRVEEEKGVGYALEIISELAHRDISLRFDIVGDGPARARLESLAEHLKIDGAVHFHGWQSRAGINTYYRKAHFFLFPSSSSEGWPKVLSEAMTYGAVPLASNVSSIPQYLRRFETGHAFPPEAIDAFRDAVLHYCERPELWKSESEKSVQAAPLFTYQAYLRAVLALLKLERVESSITSQ